MRENQHRKLAAILFADIVGYTALMQKGETSAMSILQRFEEVTQKAANKHQGEIIKVVGQQKHSDELLLNILPAEVAEELKTTGQVQPVLFEEVSILFADFQEFTNIVASIGRDFILCVIFQ